MKKYSQWTSLFIVHNPHITPMLLISFFVCPMTVDHKILAVLDFCKHQTYRPDNTTCLMQPFKPVLAAVSRILELLDASLNIVSIDRTKAGC